MKKKDNPRPVCWLCKKPILGKVYYQGGQRTHPAHKGCIFRPASSTWSSVGAMWHPTPIYPVASH